MPRVIEDSPLILDFHTTYTILRFKHYTYLQYRNFLLVGLE